jgi:hypothetical protein
MYCRIDKNKKVIETGCTCSLYPNSEQIQNEEGIYKWADNDALTQKLFSLNNAVAVIKDGVIVDFTGDAIAVKSIEQTVTVEQRLTEIETALAATLGGAN